jgi:hypothetical protein
LCNRQRVQSCSTRVKIGIVNLPAKQRIFRLLGRRELLSMSLSAPSTQRTPPFHSLGLRKLRHSSNPVAMDAGGGARTSGSGPASLRRTGCASPRSGATTAGLDSGHAALVGERGVGGRRFRRIEARDLEGSARAARERWKLERSNTFRRPATSPRSAGAFLAVTLVLAAVLWWLRRRRRRNQTAGEEGAGPLQRLSYRRIRPIFRGTLQAKGGGGQACGLGHRAVAQGGARMNVSR